MLCVLAVNTWLGRKFNTQVSISEFLPNSHFKTGFAMMHIYVGDHFSLIFSYQEIFIIKVYYYYLLLLYTHSAILPSFFPLVFLSYWRIYLKP